MTITTELLSQAIDLTLETEQYSKGIHTIIDGLDELKYTLEAITLEELWEDIHPGTLEGQHTLVSYLEDLNDFMYNEALHDNAVRTQ